jgi:DNA primase
MIAGEKKVFEQLNFETVLSKISEYDIFRWYMPNKKWEVNRVTYSPFRNESRPSFTIYSKDGRLFYLDFSDAHYRGNCFNFIMQLFNVSHIECLEMIDKDFNLGIRIKKRDDLPSHTEIVSRYKQPEKLEKKYSHIQVITRKFTNEELEYWNQYHQDIEDLKENNVYSIKKLYLNRSIVHLKETELRFGYFYDGHWKIYRPFSKDSKWFPNNTPITTMDGKDNLDKTKMAFINKSKKDYMVMKKIYPHSCAVQNEGVACFSEENVDFLKHNSSSQILSFDSDVPGVKNSKMVTEMFNFDYCNVPKYYLQEGIKDWADLAKKYGMQIIEHYLKQKFIIP